MILDMYSYYQLLSDKKLDIIYSGPLWSGEMPNVANTLKQRLQLDAAPTDSSRRAFSVFVEQVNNMLMYSAERKVTDAHARGVFVLAAQEQRYYIQSGNYIKRERVDFLKHRIDYLNTLDKEELRQYYMERIREDDDNAESRGAGLGLIEIARRASSKIEYDFYDQDGEDDLVFFDMCVKIE